MDKVKLIVIGLGGVSKKHIKDIIAHEEAEIAAIVDPFMEAVQKTRQSFPQLSEVPHYADCKQALAEGKADGALILTPHHLHYEQGMACLEAGLHVLMEKPFVHGIENGFSIIRYARSQGKHLAIAYQRHLQGPFMYIRNLIRNQELGQLRYVCAYQSQRWLDSTKGKWRQDIQLSKGGQLNDSGSHLLDVVLWTTGLVPEEVSARIDNRETQVDIDSAVTVRFQGGAMGTFNVVGSSSAGMYEDITFHGDKGAAFYRNGQLLVCREGEAKPQAVSPDQFPESSTPVRNFVDLILGRAEEPAAPAECGLLINKLTEAAWESGHNGSVIVRM
jgi:predicted dehydrogenase